MTERELRRTAVIIPPKGRAVLCVWARTLTVYSGIVLPVRQVFPRRAVTGVQQLRTPLLRLAGASVLIISAPGSRMFLPAVPAAQAGALAHALAEELP